MTIIRTKGVDFKHSQHLRLFYYYFYKSSRDKVHCRLRLLGTFELFSLNVFLAMPRIARRDVKSLQFNDALIYAELSIFMYTVWYFSVAVMYY